jgi:type II secretory pathway component PulF
MKYQYTAFNQEGETVTGEVEAETEAQAIVTIRSMNLHPTEITSTDDTTLPQVSEKKQEDGTAEFPAQSKRLRKLLYEKTRTIDRKSAYRTLGDLGTGGVPILMALDEVIKSVIFKETRVLFLKIYKETENGKSIAASMIGMVPPLEVGMIDVGEETGQFYEMLLKVSDVNIDLKNMGDDIEFVVASLMSVMVDSGLPPLRSIKILTETFKLSGKEDFAEITARMDEDIRKGCLFSEALAKYPEAFTPYFVKMVKAGELGGTLEINLKRIADSISKDYQNNGLA